MAQQQVVRKSINNYPTDPHNLWLPYREPLKNGADPIEGDILVIIPTAGKDWYRLAECVGKLRRASEGVEIRVLLVVSPDSEEARKNMMSFVQEDVVFLAGEFNFCRSINEGIVRVRENEGYILFLNDDTYFTGDHDLLTLRETLREERWCCVGPWIEGKEAPDPNLRKDRARRTNGPVVGNSVLWSKKWLTRVGFLDESFGIGWGHDESDLSIRALRLGGRWGREERVIVHHDFHATFGEEYTKGEAHTINKNYWEQKYPGLHSWGEGVEWNPLPGIAVVMAGHNVQPWLPRALESVNNSLEGFRWVLVYADDDSNDNSYEMATILSSELSADRVYVQKFRDKAKNAAEAKNKALQMYLPWRKDYPAVLFMDADDEMTRERVTQLLWRIRDNNHLMVHGDYLISNPDKVGPNTQDDGLIVSARNWQQIKGWMCPCAMIVHESIIPLDGNFWDTRVDICEDALTFLKMYARHKQSVAYPGEVCHIYHKRAGSVMSTDPYLLKRKKYDTLRREVMREAGIDDGEPDSAIVVAGLTKTN